jgi:hypothetical protein
MALVRVRREAAAKTAIVQTARKMRDEPGAESA